MTVDHPFSPGDSERYPESCVKCGRTPAAHPNPPVEPERDLALEAEFLSDAIEWAEKLGNVRWDGYAANVRRRLAIGAERYGDTAFLARDNMVEIRDETPDLAAYGLLELQRLIASGADEDEVAQDRLNLLAIAAFGALADHHAQQIVRRRAGLE